MVYRWHQFLLRHRLLVCFDFFFYYRKDIVCSEMYLELSYSSFVHWNQRCLELQDGELQIWVDYNDKVLDSLDWKFWNTFWCIQGRTESDGAFGKKQVWHPHVRTRTVARKFSIGGLCVCAGWLDIIKLTKIPLIYSVSLSIWGG